MTQQSLLNRNTSPFNRNVSQSLSISDENGDAAAASKQRDHFMNEDNYKKLQQKIKQ